jgi:hypothetical protein
MRCGFNVTPRPIYHRERLGILLVGAGWAQGQVWTSARMLASTGILSQDCPTRAVPYTDYAIPAYST